VSYALLKQIHMTCALLSYALFVLRGIWRFTDSRLAGMRWTKVVPHVNDTVLLAAAVGMAATLAPFPAMHAFLAAKVAGLVVYVLLGLTAFRWAASQRARIGAWLAAQAAFFYIVGVAVTKSPTLALFGG
jgi:uncharacterized membrane protein SirB2